jgi:hypothetical protein
MSKRILAVEDQPDNRQIIRDMSGLILPLNSTACPRPGRSQPLTPHRNRRGSLPRHSSLFPIR